METIREIINSDLKIYLIFAIFGSTIMAIQLILAAFGAGFHTDGGMESDGFMDGDSVDTGMGDFHFFSLRSIVAFIAFFGWGGVVAIWQFDIHGIKCLAIALGSGMFMMFDVAIITFAMLKMQHSGNITSKDIIDSVGTVYLRIPAGRNEIGKVTADVAGTRREIIAVADEEIPRGTAVKIVKEIDGHRFLVEKI